MKSILITTLSFAVFSFCPCSAFSEDGSTSKSQPNQVKLGNVALNAGGSGVELMAAASLLNEQFGTKAEALSEAMQRVSPKYKDAELKSQLARQKYERMKNSSSVYYSEAELKAQWEESNRLYQASYSEGIDALTELFEPKNAALRLYVENITHIKLTAKVLGGLLILDAASRVVEICQGKQPGLLPAFDAVVNSPAIASHAIKRLSDDLSAPSPFGPSGLRNSDAN